MELKSLLLSSDEKTVRVLRRVLSDLEIGVEHCSVVEDAIRRITRHRFEAIIVDGANVEKAGSVLRGAKASPVNSRALGIVLVENPVGLKGGFEIGAHFVLHKPLSVERAKASFRAVRALMKRERRLQLRVAVQIPVECNGSGQYKAKTLDLCEGGMAMQFSDRVPKENSLRFSLELPGMDQKLEIYGELAWEGNGDQAGVRFKNTTDEQRNIIRQWLSTNLPEPEQDDPPVCCRLSDLSLGGCYLTTSSPFPRGTRVVLSIKTADVEVHAGGVVLVAHPEYGMGVEFLQTTTEQRDQVHRMITTLRTNGDKSPEIQVEPDGLETPLADGSLAMFPASASTLSATDDTLVDLFRHKFQAPVESFLQQMREQHQSVDSHSG
jgi:c-di-GMP-binding flagellar brake protein YcgR